MKLTFAPIILGLALMPAHAQRTETAGIPINNDESSVPDYTLPDPLALQNGKKVTDSRTWKNERRPEILQLFESEQFGKVPGREKVSFEVFDKGSPAYGGKATRKQVTIYFTEDTSKHKTDLVIYLPENAKGPVPLFLRISFSPNSPFLR